MNDKELQQKFINFLQEKSGAKTQKDLEKYIQNLGEDGLKKAYQEFTDKMTQEQNKKTKKALHGAKLQYIKNLKHICNEDEELVYFKKGGSLDCGCVKKQQKGGETPTKNQPSWKQKFYDSKTKQFREPTKEEQEKQAENRKQASQGKGEGSYVQPKASESPKTIKKNPKIKVSACGSKMKKVSKKQTGGSLNGTTKSNRFYTTQTLPEVVVKGNKPYRFDRRVSNIGPGYNVISDVLYNEYDSDGTYLGDLSPIMGGRTIFQTPTGNDTIYGGVEHPYYTRQKYTYKVGSQAIPINRNNQIKNKNNFYKNIKKSHVEGKNPEEKAAFYRAKKYD